MATRFSTLTRGGISLRDAPGGRGRPAAGADPCPPACPACGGLECLCRPRFFAGQLLTEQDLNRLDAYVRGKHRLHNRHLHGWGVVCGMEVTCHDCDDRVRVGSGYALSPCGDDVVLCEDETVDVCKLIRACDPERRRPRCEPPRQRDPACRDAEETWVLAVCYAEHPSRGVTALRSTGCACGGRGCGSGDCGCGGAHGHGAGKGECGCGNGNGNGHGHGNGKGGCGCGTGGGSSGAAHGTSTASRLPPQCEHTVICERADFRVWRAPEEFDGKDDDGVQGALAERAMCCIQPYLDWMRAASDGPDAQASQQQRSRFCCQMKERLRGILLERPVHDCQLLARLDRLVCPAPGDEGFDQRMDRAGEEAMYIAFQGLMSCMCSVLLPPCPGPRADDCVPLATVTVRRSQGGCRVVRVCNWTVHRKFATTFPALQYWLSILPFGRYLREVMEELCCNLPARLFPRDEFEPRDEIDRSVPPPQPGAAVPEQPSDFQARASTASGAADGNVDGPTARPGGSPDGGTQGFRVQDPMPFSSARSRETSTLLASIALGSATPLDPATLARSFARRRPAGEGEGEAKRGSERRLSALEREHLPQYLLASELIPAALAGAAPHDLEALLPALMRMGERATAGRAEAAKEAAAPAEVEELRREMAALRESVQEQRYTIETLERRLNER